MDARIKAAGAQNAYFPLFIPESYLRREAQHVEGFAPELAVVTHGGGKQLAEPVVVRPTSETVIGEFMAKWIDSYRDLPLLLNQWANVVRWELRPRLFLRTSRVPLAGGAHRARRPRTTPATTPGGSCTRRTRTSWSTMLAMPVTVGLQDRPASGSPGPPARTRSKAMMGDGKALQMGTSHELGQNFAKAFDIDYLSARGRGRSTAGPRRGAPRPGCSAA